jgi:hypothetical protein
LIVPTFALSLAQLALAGFKGASMAAAQPATKAVCEAEAAAAAAAEVVAAWARSASFRALTVVLVGRAMVRAGKGTSRPRPSKGRFGLPSASKWASALR